MKLSLKWLRDYVELTLPVEELAEKLTMAGFEVTEVSRIGGKWEKVVVGQVVELSPHPNADRLRLATVDVGKERLTVVCGAPNVEKGQKVAFAYVGAELIDGHSGQRTKLEAARIRGVLSQGMVCSEKELGLLERHEGILVLPPQAPLGVPLADYMGDVILDIDVTPNHPDCLSVVGLAREVAVITGSKLKLPELSYPETGPAVAEIAQVEIADPELCPRYCATVVRGVRVGPSPAWLQERLQASGMRPINNIVDITNYVMLEIGQPLHAFDLNTLAQKRIMVRWAKPGERLATLDGEERELSAQMLVIADAQKAVAVAGVMGGLETEVTAQTTDILLESASFNYASIRRTSAQLKLRSEASLRFERGLSPGHTLPALQRASRLFLELAGGQAASGVIDVFPGKKSKPPIPLTVTEVRRLLGMEVGLAEIKRALTSLGFGCREGSPFQIQVEVPWWRSDIGQAADLVEEVARVIGYDRIPTTSLKGEIPHHRPQELRQLKDRLRALLVGLGFQEVITYSLTSAERLQQVGASLGLKVSNPLSREQECLRTSLRPGLLSVLALNQRHQESLRFFEIGKVFLPRHEGLPEEREMLALVLGGERGEPSWLGREGAVDFFDVKGVLQALLGWLKITVDFRPSSSPALVSARAAEVVVAGSPIGVVGQVHPSVAEAFDIAVPVFLVEIDLVNLLLLMGRAVAYSPLPRFPAIVRDLALIVDMALPSQRVLSVIQASPLVTQVTLFDHYTGPPIPTGKKSLAFRISYQSPQRTLTDAEVDGVQRELLERLRQELGATLRGL